LKEFNVEDKFLWTCDYILPFNRRLSEPRAVATGRMLNKSFRMAMTTDQVDKPNSNPESQMRVWPVATARGSDRKPQLK